jgi:hypothetical protein
MIALPALLLLGPLSCRYQFFQGDFQAIRAKVFQRCLAQPITLATGVFSLQNGNTSLGYSLWVSIRDAPSDATIL